jgi:dihydrolipoamide dehydrogenase
MSRFINQLEKEEKNKMTEFDVIILGAGPGGYVAAIKAAQLGLKVACIEKRDTLGGTCLNVGCIPSKALLNSSHKYHEAKHDFAKHGIQCNKLEIDIKQMMQNKNTVVAGLTKGIEGLFAKNKVTHYKGMGSFVSKNEIAVKTNDGKNEKIKGKNILIATGSEVAPFPGVEFDEKVIVSSTGALTLDRVPGKMVVIGGGVIGLEMGSVWSRLGADVTVIEYAPNIAGAMDADLCKELQKILSKQGMNFKTSHKVLSVNKKGKGAVVEFEPVEGGDKTKIECDVVLISIGRKPYTEGLGLDKVGIEVNERGQIPINDKFQTAVENIYAIGDVVTGPMLAHKAEEEGVAAVEIMAGQSPHINYNTIPGVIYTYPEVAAVGKTEQELKAEGCSYKVGKFPMMANSRARANGEGEGFVKILTDKDTDEILGAHIIAAAAGEMISEISLGMEFKAAAEDLARTCHSHPGLSEAVKEAALGAWFKSIHI